MSALIVFPIKVVAWLVVELLVAVEIVKRAVS